MKEHGAARKSLCSNCGKRLSRKTSSGDIQWKPSIIDDQGIFCETCGAALKIPKVTKDKKA